MVTGGAAGIGRASCVAFAQQGADVVVSDINVAGAEETASSVRELGRQALVVEADVTKREQVEEIVQRSIDWQGRIDLFYSNAGVGVGGPPHRVPLDDWEWIIDVNLWPHIWAVRKVIPHMLERGSGHLVHTASSAGVIGFPQLIPYCVTKFAVVGLCESLAVWGQPRNIGVSVVCPLAVATDINERSRSTPEEGMSPEAVERIRGFASRILHDTGIPPSQVAEAVVDAVRDGRLYVFPHPELKDMLDAKWADPDAWVANQAHMWEMQRQAVEQMASGS